MNTIQLGEIFIERVFEIHDMAEKVSGVILRIGKPQEIQPNHWYCPFQILGIGDEVVKAAFGVDSLKAMMIAIKMASIFLEDFARHEDKRITWLNRDDLGFSIKWPE
jgi:hypothetical protein